MSFIRRYNIVYAIDVQVGYEARVISSEEMTILKETINLKRSGSLFRKRLKSKRRA